MISLLVPTRNRPDNTCRLAWSAWDLAANPDAVEIVFYADDDAADSVPYSLADIDGVTVVSGPRIVLSDMWNRCAEQASGDIFMQCGDDIEFRTQGWDLMVTEAIESYPDRIVFAYGRDGTGIHGDDFGTHGFVHRRWLDTLGYITPPWFSSDYGDTWINDLAGRVGRKHFIPGLLTEHHHPAVGKGEWDENHRDRLARHQRDDVTGLWRSLEPRRAQDAALLQAVIDGATFGERQRAAWSRPPVDDSGYIPAGELLTWPDEPLRQLIERAAKARYGGDRNYRGRWRDLMGLAIPGRRVLDFGCGTGIEAVELARAGNRVALADISEANVELATRVMHLFGFRPADVAVVAMEAPHLPAGGEFDTFHASGVLHHIPWARQIMEEAHALLVPGGDARLMLYSDEGWRLATGTEPPEDAPSHPAFRRFVRHFDDVGEYADWYSADRLEQRFGDLFTVEHWDYLTPDRGFMAAVLRRRD